MNSVITHWRASRAKGAPRRLALAAALTALLLAALLAGAGPAGAAVITDRPLLFSFDGSDTTAGAFKDVYRVAIDNSNGAVYVSELNGATTELNGATTVDKFNSDGSATNFSATGASSLAGAPGNPFLNLLGIAVDNSGGPNQGRLYASQYGSQRLNAFAPSGAFLWTIVPPGPSEDVAVDPAGHVWLGQSNTPSAFVLEYASTGAPPAQIGSLPVANAQAIDFDASDNAYVVGGGQAKKYVGGAFSSTLDPIARDVYADQSSPTGHVFTLQAESFSEYDSSGAPLGDYAKDVVGLGEGIAYNAALDRVYVADHGSDEVDVFGAPVTGTVPDPTIEAASEVGIGRATFNATVNPQGTPNAYFFEWKRNAGAWENVSRSAPQSLPEDSSSHPVSFTSTSLFGNRTYQVRLVTVNTENGLRSVSGATTFETLTAPASPVVTIGNPSVLDASSAKVTGTIDPEEDSVEWRVEKSLGPSCNDFSGEATQTLVGGGISTPQSIEFTMKGLLAAQTYCVRIDASNSFGKTTSETRTLKTEAIPPSEVETAFVAPRADISARINGRVNPEGDADLTYRFELSEDGSNWTTLPDRVSTADGRSKVVVADELSGLEPDTTYHYRLASVENEAGPAPSTGAEKTFTTRTNAEMILPERGMEMVNSPDKGNQNVLLDTFQGFLDFPIAANGKRALWYVNGSAPGGNSGRGNTFLAERTAEGWESKVLLPPPEQQVGAGYGGYSPVAATPDLSRFFFSVVGLPSQALVRLDRSQDQALLRFYGGDDSPEVEATSDGAHVLILNPETHQVEDVGAGEPAEVISLMPGGAEASCGAQAPSRGHWIATTDASRVYFLAKPNGQCASGSEGLYLRDREAEDTTQIDPGPGIDFLRATADGRSALFLTSSKLDPGDENQGRDIYRWEQGAGKSTCLTCEVSADAQPIGRVMVSADSSHAYFESKQRLAPGATAGARNVYALSVGAAHFVADGTAGGLGVLEGVSTPQLSADGNVLVFLSKASPRLTADSVSASVEGERYRYDDRDESLECISCARGGVTSLGAGAARISADGSTIAFQVDEALTPLDVNRGRDIYVWRGDSRGLVTDGITDFPNGAGALNLRGVDEDGVDIFFTVASPGLTGFEHDGLANFYDARIGGGFEPPTPPAHCVEDSCQGPLLPAPSLDQAASAAIGGPGNASQATPRPRCAKGRVRRHGHCARKPRKHKSQQRPKSHANKRGPR